MNLSELWDLPAYIPLEIDFRRLLIYSSVLENTECNILLTWVTTRTGASFSVFSSDAPSFPLLFVFFVFFNLLWYCEICNHNLWIFSVSKQKESQTNVVLLMRLKLTFYSVFIKLGIRIIFLSVGQEDITTTGIFLVRFSETGMKSWYRDLLGAPLENCLFKRHSLTD